MAKTLFKKPKWLKPELNTVKYWVHLAILTFVMLGALKIIFGHDMLTIDLFLKTLGSLSLGDIAVHTLLKMN